MLKFQGSGVIQSRVSKGNTYFDFAFTGGKANVVFKAGIDVQPFLDQPVQVEGVIGQGKFGLYFRVDNVKF